jgi:LysM repeat protein
MRRALAALVLAVALPMPGLADLVVQPGETLSEIAERNGVGLQQLMRLNGIQNPKLVQAGQRLVLPGAAKGGDAKGGTVVVQPGETLSEIAERNGIGLQQLMRLNGIQNPAMVEAGRRLVVSGGSTAAGSGVRNSRSFSYTVKEGETLSELAERYDTTVQLLLQRNRIGSPSELQAGSQLLIPGNRPTTSSGTSSSGMASRAATSKPAGLAYSSKDKEHVVQAGESLSQIAEGYKLPLDRLVVINNISNPDLVISGTRLKLTAPPPLNPARPTPPAKSTSVASQASQKPASPKPAPAKPPGAKPSAKAPTPATKAQSFPAAPTSKPQLTPQVLAAKPAAAQANPSNALTPSRAQAQTVPVQNSPVQTGRSASPAAISAASSVAIAAAAKPAANAATTTATAAPTAAATSTAAATKSTTALTTTATATAAAPTANASAMAGVRVARGSSAPGNSAIGNSAAGTAIAGTAAGVTPTTGGAVATRALGGSKPQPSPITTKPVGPDWRTYGPMSVDWANWQSMGGSYVTPSLNGEGQPLYTAINCGARKLNATSQSGQWKTWESPRNDAEQQLVNDLCKAKGG